MVWAVKNILRQSNRSLQLNIYEEAIIRKGIDQETDSGLTRRPSGRLVKQERRDGREPTSDPDGFFSATCGALLNCWLNGKIEVQDITKIRGAIHNGDKLQRITLGSLAIQIQLINSQELA